MPFLHKNGTSFILLIILPLYSTVVLADFNRGLFAYNHYDYQTARTEFRLAAVDGHAGAQYYLGEIHEGGIGTPIDYKLAHEWYWQAAKQEHAAAQARLAALYQEGQGVDQDANRAFNWYLRSAGNGYPLAQFEVGLRYARGQGTPVNTIEAYRWLTTAASYGDPEAMDLREALVAGMTPVETARASALALEWESAREKEPY